MPSTCPPFPQEPAISVPSPSPTIADVLGYLTRPEIEQLGGLAESGSGLAVAIAQLVGEALSARRRNGLLR